MSAQRIDLKVLGPLIGMFLLALFFWDWAFMYPIKVFVVLLHELGHGLAAVVSGGEIVRIELSANLGGVCWSRGGWTLLVLPAGYLGSMFFGGLILVGAARTRHDRLISMGLGVMVLLVTVLYVRSLFGFVFGLGFGLLLVGLGRWAPEQINDLWLKFLGLTSSMYAVIDIKEDLISRTVPGSDAWAMSKAFLLPPVFWGVLWIAIALVATGFFLWIAARGGAGSAAAPMNSKAR
ncbi:MAG: M50 family metallopeptidase [Pseudomonadota bacterium]